MKILYKDKSFVVQLLLMATFINTAINSSNFSLEAEEVQEEDIDSNSTLNVEQYTTNLIMQKLPPSDYSKNIRPNAGLSPVQVNISLRINDLSEISETSMVTTAAAVKIYPFFHLV